MRGCSLPLAAAALVAFAITGVVVLSVALPADRDPKIHEDDDLGAELAAGAEYVPATHRGKGVS